MRLRLLLFRVSVVAIALWVARPAHACECLKSNPCQMVGLSGAVFTGIVLNTTEESKELISIAPAGQRRTMHREIVARFQIQTVFKGLPLDQKLVEVRTAPTGGECGMDFKVGEAYLVYAHQLENGRFSTSICSRTRPLKEAKDEIPLIESFLVGKRLTGILGTVNIYGSSSPLPAWLDRSVAEGMEIEVRGDRQSFRTTADSLGMFRVWNVPDGTYTIRPVLGEAYIHLLSTNYPLDKVSIGREACSADAYAALPLGKVSGRILNSNGKPVSTGTKVSLFDTKPNSRKPSVLTSGTDPDGRYEFVNLVPGRYILHVGDVFYGTDLSKDTTIDLWSTWGAGVDIQLGK